jgi:REP element-mobilizing transposase RayT
MSRGNRREDIFRDDLDRESFLETLAESRVKTDWQFHAWCLMPNHFHLVIETPKANLVVGMKWLLGAYTGRFNRRHKVGGHLFGGRYKALVVDGSGNGYLKTVCDYVHLNPARAKLLAPEEKLSEYPWSSCGDYLDISAPRRRWLRVDRLLGEHRIPKDTPAGREEFGRQMEIRRAAPDNEEFKEVVKGWCVGSQSFRKELLAQINEKAGPEHFGDEIRESDEAKAERIVGEELRKLGWREAELDERLKGDAEKIRIAKRLRADTTMTLEWIAGRLRVGTKTHLSHLLYWDRREREESGSGGESS